MSRTNLAYIDTAADAALKREMEDPSISAAVRERASGAKLKVVAGFPVDDEAAPQQVLEHAQLQRKAVVERYFRHRAEVADKLEELGIKPLGILPKAAWQRICTESGLIRLNPDAQGDIAVSSGVLKDLDEKSFDVMRRTRRVLYVLAGICCLAGGLRDFFFLGEPLRHCIVASIVVFVLLQCFIALFWMVDFIPRWAIVRWHVRNFDNKPWKEVIKEFFPECVSYEINHLDCVARLMLPQPPADVLGVLLKAKFLELKVAAVAEAISFLESPSEILRKGHDRIIKDRMERRRQAIRDFLNDPIVYHEHGSAVAIISQFGDFPIEQQIVDRVVNSEHLI